MIVFNPPAKEAGAWAILRRLECMDGCLALARLSAFRFQSRSPKPMNAFQFFRTHHFLTDIMSTNYQLLLDLTHDYRTTEARDDKKLLRYYQT